LQAYQKPSNNELKEATWQCRHDKRG
jgi:hypothetical protein